MFNKYEFSDRKLSWSVKKENREEILCAIGFVILVVIVWLGISLATV